MMVYRVNNHRIEVQDPDDGKYHDFCEEISITKVVSDILGGKKEVEIMVYSADGEEKIILPRGKINRHILPTLIERGLTVIDNNLQVDVILQILLESEANAIREYKHERLGFCTLNDDLIFLAHQPIGLSDPLKSKSEFAFPESTKPKGTFESWKSLMKNEVLGRTYLELVLALGVVAPIAHLLKGDGVLSLIPVFAFIGRSSSGKTTALKLMASIYGSPTESEGMISDLNATQNAFFAYLNSRYGMPALVDETSSVPEWDFGKLLYNLPKGREKLRCDSEGKLRIPATYSGCVIFTGERSLFEQCNSNNGLHARLMEFTFPWTDDADHSMRIEYGCLNNYGTAVTPLITWLLKNREKLAEMYFECYVNLKNAIPTSDGVEDRLIKTHALILVAANVVKSALKLDIDIKNIKNLLVEHHQSDAYVQNHKNFIENIYEHIKQSILNNYSNFPQKNETKYTRQLWGVTGVKNDSPCVWIAEEHIVEFLRNAKVYANATSESDKAVMKALHDKGRLLKYYGDRYKKDEYIGNTQAKCYCLLLHGTDEIQPKPKKKRRTKSASQLSTLLSEDNTD